jgi:uncharacterized protein HemY
LAIVEEVVRKAPAGADFRYHLGMVQLRHGLLEKAHRSLEQATVLGQQSPFLGYEGSKVALESL